MNAEERLAELIRRLSNPMTVNELRITVRELAFLIFKLDNERHGAEAWKRDKIKGKRNSKRI